MAFVNLVEVLKEEGAWGNLHPPVQGAFEALEFFYPDDFENAEESIVYDRARAGHCMTCDGPLGELTMLCINRAGIVMVYCCGQCYTDMQVTQWIEEQYEDLVTAIKFRGGKVDGQND